MSEVPLHISSQRLSASSGWWRGIGGFGLCLRFAISIVFFWAVCGTLPIRSESSTLADVSGKKTNKLQIYSHHSGKRGLAEWRNGCAYFREAYCMFCAFSLSFFFPPRWLKLLFCLILFSFSFPSRLILWVRIRTQCFVCSWLLHLNQDVSPTHALPNAPLMHIH